MMKSYRKSSLSLALGVALCTAALVPATSFAFSVNNNAIGGEILTADGGDSLLFPFYTTFDGSSTSFSVTNTSADTIAAKVRVREQLNSRDVRDFIVILSPEDKFDFWIEKDSAGLPTVFWKDNSCVVGHRDNTLELKQLPVNPNDGDATVGHVEVMGMVNLSNVSFEGYPLAAAAKHNVQGFPENCQPLYKAFSSRDNVNSLIDETRVITDPRDPNVGEHDLILKNLADFDVGNVLTGSYVVTAGAAGIEGGDTPVVIRNSFNRAVLAAQSPENCTGKVANFTNGNQAAAECFGIYSWDGIEETHPHLGDINWVSANPADPTSPVDPSIVANMDGALTALALRGDWSNNPENSVYADWIATYPSKYVYLDDCDGDKKFDEFVNVGNKATGLLDKCKTPSPFGPGGAGPCMGKAAVDAYDYEEGVASRPSPSDKYSYGNCNETNVFTYAQAGQSVPEASDIQAANLREVRWFEQIDLSRSRGWINQPLVWQPHNTVPTHVANNLPGAATQGLLWIVRSTSDLTGNDGSLRALDRNND